ncbi:hypothetical protein L3Y34_013578 [Caenorhabditis briggsae]|uniref:Uncharacterized protein n=1 Tax=Caenorhabditis briggsae TaxID=6238 RepID=A0AAE9CWU4_CAEBR|nr:hypothetical protein L3Y34_013578 [Caenorhabditis briggsae]
MDEITPARDRDALLAIFSFHVMLRASEAAEIKWEGVTQKDGMIEVHVEKAKNDQLRLGRSSFFNYDPGSDADILMCRWRIHSRGKCSYVFSNLDGSKKLTKSSISALATKMRQLENLEPPITLSGEEERITWGRQDIQWRRFKQEGDGDRWQVYNDTSRMCREPKDACIPKKTELESRRTTKTSSNNYSFSLLLIN